MFSKSFWIDALERAVKSGAQAVVLAWGVGERTLSLFTVDFQNGWKLAVGGAFLSLLTSLGSAPFGKNGSASLAG